MRSTGKVWYTACIRFRFRVKVSVRVGIRDTVRNKVRIKVRMLWLGLGEFQGQV